MIQIITKEFGRIFAVGTLFLSIDLLAYYFLPLPPLFFIIIFVVLQLITTLSIGDAAPQGYVEIDFRTEQDKLDEQYEQKLAMINNSKILLFNKVQNEQMSEEDALNRLETLEKLLELPKHRLLCEAEIV